MTQYNVPAEISPDMSRGCFFAIDICFHCDEACDEDNDRNPSTGACSC